MHKKQHYYHLFTFFLILCLLCGFIPLSLTEHKLSQVKAAETLHNPKIKKDSSMRSGQKVTWDCVWFGSYPQTEITSSKNLAIYTSLATASESRWTKNNDIIINGTKYRRLRGKDATLYNSNNGEDYYNWNDDDTTYHYFKYEPIKWRILKVNDNSAFLLADIALDNQLYNINGTDVTWKTSSIRSWLNGYGSSFNEPKTDYSSKNFINSAFSPTQQNIILTSTIINQNNISYNTPGGDTTSDKIFLLSESEVYNTVDAQTYGFLKEPTVYDEARRCLCSTYAAAMGALHAVSSDTKYNGNTRWLLRSPGTSNTSCVYVTDNVYGIYNDGGSVTGGWNHAIRPALYLNLEAVNAYSYSYAGTVCSDGTVDETNNITKPENRSFNTDTDIWSFSNEKDDIAALLGYQLLSDDYLYIKRRLLPSDYEAVFHAETKNPLIHAETKNPLISTGITWSINTTAEPSSIPIPNHKIWTGSCYGMSAWSCLASSSELFKKFGTRRLHDIPMSDNTESAINFYHIQQYIPSVSNAFHSFYAKTEKQKLQELEKLVSMSKPTLLFFGWCTNPQDNASLNADSSSGHVVVAYDKEDGLWHQTIDKVTTAYKHRIKIYDCSHPNGGDNYYLYYTDDYKIWCIPGYSVRNEGNSTLDSLHNNGSIIYAGTNASDYIQIPYYDNLILDTTAINHNRMKPYTILRNRLDRRFYIQKNKDTSTKIKGIGKHNAYYRIPSANITTDGTIDKDAVATTMLPDSNASYTVYSEKNEPMDFTVLRNHIFSSATSDKPGNVTFGKNGSLNATTTQESTIYATLTRDSSSFSNYPSIDVSSKDTKNLNVNITSDGNLLLESDSLNDTTIVCRNKDISSEIPVSITDKKLLLKEELNGEVGIYQDNDNDGDFENRIAVSGPKDIKITSLKLTGLSKQIAAGKKLTLKAKILPENASNQKLTWRSSNKKVATVSSAGVVKLKRNSGGKKVKITATTTDGSKISASWKITSMKGIVKKVRISGRKTVKAGKTLKLKARITASRKANRKLLWKSSNTKYATVNSKGVVKAKKSAKGKTVKVTAMATDGSNKKATIKIKVK